MKNLIIITFTCFLALSSTMYSNAQDAATDTQQFDAWMQRIGLNQALVIKDLTIKNDSAILRLTFKSIQPDSMVKAWTQIKYLFETKNGCLLEEQLFYKLLHLTNVKPINAVIEIRDIFPKNKDEAKKVNFKNIISYNQDKKMVESKNKIFKSKETFQITYSELSNMTTWKIDIANVNPTRKEAYDKIIAYAREFYKAKISKPDKNFVANNYYIANQYLEFEVRDLTSEVLTQSQRATELKDAFFQSINKDICTKEYIKFKFSFQTIPNGISLTLKIEGRFANAPYDLMDWKKCMNMEPLFVQQIDQYTQDFIERVRGLF